jgi:hypothetical protein
VPIATATGKLAIMELDVDWEPGLPLSPASLDQAARQQLLWGFPEVLWGAAIDNNIYSATLYLSKETPATLHLDRTGPATLLLSE